MFLGLRSACCTSLMATTVVLLTLLVRSGSAADRDAPLAASSALPIADSDSSDARIGELIRQLGSSQYTVRRSAANEIRKIGPEAFDQLHAATDSADPEIAANSRYLMRQIAVRWTRSDDSATVRRLMRGYDDRNDAERQRIIQMLAALSEHEGVAGLCRVARFDRTPLLSRPPMAKRVLLTATRATL